MVDDAALLADCYFRRVREESIEPDPIWDTVTLKLKTVQVDYKLIPGELESLIRRDITEGRITQPILDYMLAVPWCQEGE